jgi:nicotinamidase-related amidase
MTKKALLLIGYQNDYFAEDGILKAVVEESVSHNDVLENTLALMDKAKEENTLIIATPIVFSDDYRELDNPVGILKICQDLGAFKKSSNGSNTIEEFKKWNGEILELPGKTGLNAFSNTKLKEVLKEEGVEEVVVAGVVTSVCIDSTARAAADQGYPVTVVSDCTAGRNNFEQDFYCEQIFPIFASVKASSEVF